LVEIGSNKDARTNFGHLVETGANKEAMTIKGKDCGYTTVLKIYVFLFVPSF
jgi:hypothetical protein